MRTTPEETERNNQIILEAAVKCFARMGFESTSLNDVAREVGMSRGPLYYRYKNKETLYLAAYNEFCSNAMAEYIRIFRQEKPILELLRDDLNYCVSSDYNIYSFAHPEPKKHPEAYKIYSSSMQKLKELKSAALRKAVQNGEMRSDVDVNYIVNLLFVFTDGLYQNIEAIQSNKTENNTDKLIDDLLYIIEKRYCVPQNDR